MPLLPYPGVVAVVGPTAAGKSALSIALAHALGGEVVNADSMQLYRGMDIGTAKLTVDEREGVPHHVLDVWDVREPASVAAYQELARAAVDDILARGRVPLLVGGSGLYVRAVLEEFEFPGTDPAIRERLEAELAADGPAPLYARLAKLDEPAATKILPSNGRRIVRALEVTLGSGRPFSSYGPGVSSHPPTPFHMVGLERPADDLAARIEARYVAQMAAGFLDEVAALRGHPKGISRTAAQALGYKELLAHLDGALSLEEAVDLAVRRTRRFARRQRAWFGRDPRIRWLDGAADENHLVGQFASLVG